MKRQKWNRRGRLGAICVLILSQIAALPAAAERWPSLKIILLSPSEVDAERANDLITLRTGFERRLRIAINNDLKVRPLVISDLGDAQTNFAMLERGTEGLEDLFLPSLGPWLVADNSAAYYVVGELASFRGDTELDWQLVERLMLSDMTTATWRFHPIETVTFAANVDASGLRDNAADIVDTIGAHAPPLRKEGAVPDPARKKVKMSCFLSDEGLRALLSYSASDDFGTDFERGRSEFLGRLLPILPSLLAVALKDHGFEEQGHLLEATNVPEVHDKCMAQDERNVYHYLDTTMDDVDYLIWGIVGVASRDTIGFQPRIELSGGQRTELLDEWQADKWDEELIASDLARYIMANWRKLFGSTN